MDDPGRPEHRGRMLALAFRIYGEPPARDASELVGLLWLRRLQIKLDVVAVIGFALAAVFIHATWVYAFAAVWALWAAITLARIQRRIGRAL